MERVRELQAELDALPPGTTMLNLSNRGLTTAILSGLRFPNSILQLSLRENQIDSLDGVTFPDRLRMLDLERNNIRVVTEANFPQSLRILYIQNNPVFNIMGGMINRRGLRYSAQADDDYFLALSDEEYGRKYLQVRQPRAAPPPVQLPPGIRLSPVRIARTYGDYRMIMTSEGYTEEECREAMCETCAAPFVNGGDRLAQPVVFHETHKTNGRSMWSHPCHLSDMARLQVTENGHILCPICRAIFDITPQQLQAIAASTLQRVVRGHQSRQRTKKSKTNTKAGGKKRKQRKQKQKRTLKKRKHSMKRK
jgi:hypothetical protein